MLRIKCLSSDEFMRSYNKEKDTYCKEHHQKELILSLSFTSFRRRGLTKRAKWCMWLYERVAYCSDIRRLLPFKTGNFLALDY